MDDKLVAACSDVSGSCNHPICSARRGDNRSIEDPTLLYRSDSQHSLVVSTLLVDRVVWRRPVHGLCAGLQFLCRCHYHGRCSLLAVA